MSVEMWQGKHRKCGKCGVFATSLFLPHSHRCRSEASIRLDIKYSYSNYITIYTGESVFEEKGACHILPHLPHSQQTHHRATKGAK